MVQNPRKQSLGYKVQISMLMELLVQADLGVSTKLHAKKVLTNKQRAQPEVTKSLAGATEQNVPNPKKRKHKGGAKKTQTKSVTMKVTTPTPHTTTTQTVDNIGVVDPTNFESEEDSETDSCPLVQRRCRKKQESELSDSETTNSMTLTHFLKRRRTQRQDQQSGWTGVTIATQPDQIPNSITESEEIHDCHFSQGGGDHFDENQDINDRTEQGGRKEQENTTDRRDGFHHDSIPLEQLLEWGETGDITELSEHRSFILYKPFELGLEKIYLAHLSNFKMGVTSVNHDVECIRRLHKELRMIAAVPRIELDSLAGDGQDTTQTKGHQIEQSGNNDTAMTSYEHQAQEIEPTSQTDEPRNKGNEHQDHAEPRSAITPPATIVSDHQDPESSNLPLVATFPQDSSTLQFLSTAAQSLCVMSTRVSSLDLSFARLRDDTKVTRHHTTKLRDELKIVAKSQLAAIVEDLKDTGVAKNGEGGGSTSLPR
ncbi:hypothetical protein F511_34461 [Dorcoceras hygrometricum]|uniref:Uncharacterized protein n=1 Tax=Dorcoceras hygrometricum TaxID=472368 RepID=A0A2Z7BMF2_9LAMI|nr:hypothetical protein F511_34461 [Dorcoceras hygrometricum]